MNKKKVVILGGGTGSSRVLMSLKDLPIDITAVVTVSDNGSSTGKLREEFSIPAVGDIRKVISNLSPLDSEIKEVIIGKCLNNPQNYFNYRGTVEDILEDCGLPSIRRLKLLRNSS